MKNIKKFVFMELLCLIAFGIVFIGASKEADLDSDVFKFDDTPTYEEWKGTYSPEEINTRIQIYDIGRRLGRGISYQERVEDDPFPFVKGNPAYKYSAARIYGSEKRGADVIYIGKTASVDTIKCLRMIVSGYLQQAFSMDEENADKIALTAIYWNTSVYGKKDFFNEVFDERVLSVFDDRTKDIGLSSNFRDWPGKTKIVIPHQFANPIAASSTTESEAAEEESAPVETVATGGYAEEPKRNEDDFDVVTVKNPVKANPIPLPMRISIVFVILAMIAAFIVLIIKNLDAVATKKNEEEKKGA
jgi:hypothetical protein